jgi:hypothetical protein
MGLAWVPDDTGRAAGAEPGLVLTGRPRHRRPTLLARSGHAVAGRLNALARTDTQQDGPYSRPTALAARRYWT